MYEYKSLLLQNEQAIFLQKVEKQSKQVVC